jgi:hypothetical protein
MTQYQNFKSTVIYILSILYHFWDPVKFCIFTFNCQLLYKERPKMIGSIETCSVWKNNNKYGFCHMEYVVLFMCVYIHDGLDSFKLKWPIFRRGSWRNIKTELKQLIP